jgi:hypothetical protein
VGSEANFGQNFEGRLAFTIQRGGKELAKLRYLSRGTAARFQYDHGKLSNGSIDVLFDAKTATRLFDEKRNYYTIESAKIHRDDENDGSVEKESSGQRKSIQGMVCTEYRIKQENGIVAEACLRGLPGGSFETDAFEALTKLDIPPWLENVMQDKLMPLSARVHDGKGNTLYTVELEQYGPEPVSALEVQVPANFQRVDVPADLAD